jgi:hypothetical protein
MDKTMNRVCILVMIFVLCGCINNSTPKKFVCNPKIDSTIYKADVAYLNNLISQLIIGNIAPFDYKDIYDNKSKMSIDTIFYSPKIDKLVVFVIVKNAYVKLDSYNYGINKYMYEGFHFYGFRSNTGKIILNKNCVFMFDSESKEDLKDAFYSYAFIRKSTDHPFDGEPQYNLNDIRLWSSKQMEFEMKDSTNLVLLEKDTLRLLTDIR